MAREREIVQDGKVNIKVNTESVKCPSCGANMIFDADKQLLYCEHCETTKTIENIAPAKEIDLMKGISNDKAWEDATVVFSCDNCGAKVILQKGETASNCPFCGTAHVQKSDELAGIKPNAVLPFLFGQDKAVEYTKTWVKKRWLAPRDFRKNINNNFIKGVYTPCFTFDSYTSSRYVGRIGKHYTVTVGSGKDARTVTHTEWRTISGTYYDAFDDILITAGDKFTQKELDKTSPYDTNESRQYQEQYLLGYMAYHYDTGIEGCWDKAKGIIDGLLRNRILRQYSYDVVDYLNVSTNHDKVTYKYVMLPVYVGNYNYKKKLYNYYINGRNGKVFGKSPKSPLKITGLVLGGLAIVGVIAYFILKYLVS